MPINLNAFPLKFPAIDIEALAIPYEHQLFESLIADYQGTHAIRRHGENILIFSPNGQYPIKGDKRLIPLQDNYGLLCFLFKDGLKRKLVAMGRRPFGFHPIELLSTRPEDNLLTPIMGAGFPFQIVARYKLNTRIINGVPCLVIDSSTRRNVRENCAQFVANGFNLIGRYVMSEGEDGRRKLLGRVLSSTDEELHICTPDSENNVVFSGTVYLEASVENFDDYIAHSCGQRKDLLIEQIRSANSTFNGGENKKKRIKTLKTYFQKDTIHLIDGTPVPISDEDDVQRSCSQLSKPVFVFNDNGEADWAEKGLTRFGPYTKRTFDRNDPSICIICSQQDQGRVEQFVRKLLKGMPRSKYFTTGLEGKFSIGTGRVEVFVTVADDVTGYKDAIERALKQKADSGGRWDLALVQIRERFKSFAVVDNPYYWGKNLFFLHQIPVQDFTIELLNQDDYSLGFSLNNMALACYAKMGGVPWLLKSSPTLSHELVVGIGSAHINQERFGNNQRIMGITTVFSGDGSYIVSNTSKAVAPDAYCEALTWVLNETIEKISRRMNWQKGDTIRLVFHASVKKFNRDEIKAVRAVVDKYRSYQVEYAFLKISENHGLHMFDSSTANAPRGKLAPLRGTILQLSKFEKLVYLIGQRELRQSTDGHPRGVILSVHKDSTFKDIKYLTAQLYNFSAHSWRSYFPNPMPVTISYSDLIARRLGWLNQLSGWNDSIMIGKIGQSQWFL